MNAKSGLLWLWLPVLLLLLLNACQRDSDFDQDDEADNDGFGEQEDADDESSADPGGDLPPAPDDDFWDDDAADDDTQDDDTTAEDCAQFSFSLRPGQRDLPVPSDFFTFPDPSTPTGLRVYWPAEVTPLFQRVRDDFDFITYSHNELDGFSVISPIYLPVSESLIMTGATGLEPSADDPIFVLDFNPDSPTYGQPVPIRAEYSATYGAVLIRPRFSFPDQSRFLVVVTDKMRTVSGRCLAPSEQFAYLQRQDDGDEDPEIPLLEPWRDKYRPLWNFLEEQTDVTRADTLLAFTYTTQTVMQDMANIWDRLEKLRLTHPPEMLDVEITYPAEGEFGARVHGWLKVPDWQGRDGVFERDPESQEPVFTRWIEIPFLLLLPRYDGAYPQPFPAAIYQHWSLGQKENAEGEPGQHLAANGVAVIAIDAVCHGERGGNMDEVQVALCFYEVFNPLVLRDNFRQTLADQMRLTHLIQSLDDLDILPEGGDGIPDLDPDRLFYQGDSMGSIFGIMSAATNPQTEGYFLVAGSGYYEYIGLLSTTAAPIIDLLGLVEDMLGLDFFDDAYLAFDLLQGVLDAGDPVAFARYVAETPAWIGAPKQIFYAVPAWDEILPHEATEYVVRAAALPLAEPYVYPVEDVTTVSLPVTERAYLQGNSADHGFFWGGTAEAVRLRTMYEHFVRTLLDTGTGEIAEP